MNQVKLVLLDIDGTIILTKGAGRRVLEESINRVHGSPLDASKIRFSGKTDPQIIREILEFNEIEGDKIRELRDEILEDYIDNFSPKELEATLEILPGIVELVDLIEKDDSLFLGLLTGNVEPTAYMKVEAAGLDRSLFPIGGYGSDHEDRYQIPQIVMNKWNSQNDTEILGSEMLIVGDTEHDIKCGREVVAKSLAVATGHYTVQELQNDNPDLVYEDLSDYDQVFADIKAL